MKKTLLLHGGGQLEVALDDHKYRVINAGRQWGKSVLARAIIYKWAFEEPGIYWIVSPTYRQGKQNHWTDIKREITAFKNDIVKTNDTELSIEFKNGSSIVLKGAENPDSLRGATLKGLCVDEIASIRNWDWLWNEVLAATLIRHDGPVVFISTPQGFNHFYDIFQYGQKEDPIWKSWKFTSYDNPHLPKNVIDRKKKELTQDTFAQEYMADFRKFTGLVYKGFEKSIHVISPFEVPESWQIYRGFDFGNKNPTAILWIAVDNDNNWFIIDEQYAVDKTIDHHAGMVNANAYSSSVVASYGDPSGAQWIRDFADRGIFITPANKEKGSSNNSWVGYGIEKIAERLKPIPGHTVGMVRARKAGLPGLFVFSHCENVIREFEVYRWKRNQDTQAQDLNEPDVPEKANDHAMDALRYFAVSYQKQTTYIPRDDKNWNIGT